MDQRGLTEAPLALRLQHHYDAPRAICLVVLLLVASCALLLQGCAEPEAAATAPMPSPEEDALFELSRDRMVEKDIEPHGITDSRVVEAMRDVPRHLFVPAEYRGKAYDDTPLPIGEGQTISQPYMVALMSQLLEVDAGARILEVGTGSGYQAAVLAQMGAQVYSIEIIPTLGERARELLTGLGYESVRTRVADGYFGWEEHAPFDGIIVTAAAD